MNYVFAGTEGPVRTQDYKDVFKDVSSTAVGLDVLIDFLVNNLKTILEQLPNGEETASYIYSICTVKAALDNEIIKVSQLKPKNTN